MPYAILAGSLPAGKTGIYMGIFNFFIVIPEILAALGFGTLLERLLTDESTIVAHLGGDNRLAVVVIGGLSLAVAAALCTIVVEPEGYPMRPVEYPVHTEDPSTLSPRGRRPGEG
jgi:predicted membrane-bound spermidine synthase